MKRFHRLRATPAMRRLVADVRLSPSQLVLPIFVHEAEEPAPIEALPGHARVSPAGAASLAKEAASLGIGGVLIFGIPSRKTHDGRILTHPKAPAQRGIAAIRDAVGDALVVAADTCLCSATTSGHCGVVDAEGRIDNDATLPILVEVAVSQAAAGADLVAPSDMMDGRVAAIRTGLDAAGYVQTGIWSYAAKYASAFYGPFRDAADCAPSFGDRAGYQIDPGSRRQGLAAIERDLAEGADLVMIKPALAYLDVIAAARARFDVPIAAYSVSGEYAMIAAAAASGALDARLATLEALVAITRAGADIVVTYAALDAARWLAEG